MQKSILLSTMVSYDENVCGLAEMTNKMMQTSTGMEMGDMNTTFLLL